MRVIYQCRIFQLTINYAVLSKSKKTQYKNNVSYASQFKHYNLKSCKSHIVRNKRRPYVILDFFQALQPYQRPFIKFWIFSISLFFIIRLHILFSRFCQIFQALHCFKALRLFFLTIFPDPMFIPCSMSIPDSRVVCKILNFNV